jgi:2-hydroxychromene-2-carboxylate isomerase
MDILEFYCDPVSPYAWLAIHSLPELAAELPAKIVIKPVLFAGLLNANGTKGPAEIPAKRRYVFKDVMRKAAMRGLHFSGPPTHPFNPLKSLRIATAIEDHEKRSTFMRQILTAAWEEGKDISNVGVILKSGHACDLEDGWMQAAVVNVDVKTSLKLETGKAAESGAFGVPTFRFRNEIFWGNDSIESLRWVSRGGRMDEEFYKKVIARPASSGRGSHK